MSKISFHLEEVSFTLKHRKLLKQWIEAAIANEGKMAGEIHFILCRDEYLLDINKRFLAHDYYTDVITFDYSSGHIVSGDVYISVDRVKENALEYGVTPADEMRRIMIHGVLHLIGYQDTSPILKENMRGLESKYLTAYYTMEIQTIKPHKSK